MAIVTIDDVNDVINKIVADLTAKCYVISNFTHGGSYSNTEGHLDMIKPNDKSHIIRIWAVTRVYDIDDKFYRHIDTATILISRYTRKDGFDGKCHSQTLCPNSGEVLSEHIFYKICDRSECNGCKVYTDNLDEAKKILKIQHDRYCSYVSKNDYYPHSVEISKLPANFIDHIMNRINSIRGFKRATASCITNVMVGRNYNGKMAADVYYSQNGKDGVIKLR